MEVFGLAFGGGGGLKHLEFVRTLVAAAVAVLSWLYRYVKEKSGGLKACINTQENFIKAVIGPVYEKTKALPGLALSFLDKKVEELAPASVKKVLKRANEIVDTASLAMKVLALQIKILGPDKVIALVGAVIKQSIATSLTILVYRLNRYPVLRTVGGITFSVFSFFSKIYNELVTELSTRGFPIFSKLPLIPIEDLTKAFQQIGVAPGTIVDTNIFGGLTGAFKQVRSALADKDDKNITENLTKTFQNILAVPEENNPGNIIEDLAKAIKQVGLVPAHKDDTNVIQDLTKAFRQAGEETAKKDGNNIVEGLTKAFKQVGLAPEEKDDSSIVEGLTKAFQQVGLAPEKKDDSNITEDLTKAIKSVVAPAEKNARNVIEGLTKGFTNILGSTSEKGD